ncbi:hypothetical protein EDD18DRAFT_1109152 [Armillaria luteobubalina]|uniref:Uncharacterized protein n=1 Tax=Armillaria luteobubalina TaxID=153913 RepID=A0AA39PXI4_9AGAR|nr:hypothetical protein EDD18DRAFT_1109152 [Armillaria luteobubalina]
MFNTKAIRERFKHKEKTRPRISSQYFFGRRRVKYTEQHYVETRNGYQLEKYGPGVLWADEVGVAFDYADPVGQPVGAEIQVDDNLAKYIIPNSSDYACKATTRDNNTLLPNRWVLPELTEVINLLHLARWGRGRGETPPNTKRTRC